MQNWQNWLSRLPHRNEIAELESSIQSSGESCENWQRGGDSSADPWVSIESVRQGLAAKNLLVNLVRLTPDAKKSSPPRYLAWLIPAATGGNIQIVDLAEAQPIDDAVGAFRKAMETATQRVENNDRESKERLEGTLATLGKISLAPVGC